MFILFETQTVREREKDRYEDRDVRDFHLPVHSPNACSSRDRARPKPGSLEFYLVSPYEKQRPK